jgi:hypothetical protein
MSEGITQYPEVVKSDPIVVVWPDGTIHTGTRGSGVSEIGLGTLVLAGCALPGGALGTKKNKRHVRMLSGPLALTVVRATEAAGYSPGELVVTVAHGRVDVGAFAEARK